MVLSLQQTIQYTDHALQTLAGTLARLTQSDFGSVEYSGLELIKYYLNLLENNFSGYPWQIVTSYTIAMTCIIMLVVLFMLFLFRVWRHQRRKKKEKEIYEYYSDKFHLILGSAETLTHDEILEMLGQTEDDIRKNDTYYYANILEEARMALYEIVCLPNMQTLATSLGVVDRFTFQLLKHKDVFRTLQMLLMLQITVNEGLLANFVNHTNREIRMMARLNYITCSRNIPYRYLITELNEEQSLYRPMILNYVFGWMMFQERLMPNFLNLADRVTNEDSAAFLVREVAYWGKENEKEEVKNYFLDERLKVRSAAIEVVAMLGDVNAEEKLVESYFMQPEHIRQEVLRALLSLNSGRQTEFFKKAYEISSSRETHVVALQCLYQYGNSGRRLFEIMRSQADEETRKLIDQVDSAVLLEQLQVL
ncbi:MAG: hypothetical protein PUH57_03680 [Prevotellaceae bacterium]|nr:hypothetical protein [Prevotellaceae bacterium]MDY2748956.1 hypothetical protein [Prevotella sp.]